MPTTNLLRRPAGQEALIRMHACTSVTLTTGEYERLQREVRGRVLADDAGISDVILVRLLEENAPRYYEAKRINKGDGDR